MSEERLLSLGEWGDYYYRPSANPLEHRVVLRELQAAGDDERKQDTAFAAIGRRRLLRCELTVEGAPVALDALDDLFPEVWGVIGRRVFQDTAEYMAPIAKGGSEPQPDPTASQHSSAPSSTVAPDANPNSADISAGGI